MFGFTKKTEYALIALTRLVQQETEQGEPLSARQIAEEYGLPAPLLMNVLKDLQRHGIVTSIRGARGGYRLEHASDELTVLQIVEVIEGPLKTADCCQKEDQSGLCNACDMLGTCPISHAVQRLHDKLSGFLAEMTLQDFAMSPREEKLLTFESSAKTIE